MRIMSSPRYLSPEAVREWHALRGKTPSREREDAASVFSLICFVLFSLTLTLTWPDEKRSKRRKWGGLGPNRMIIRF
jgi:hypothetical protein